MSAHDDRDHRPRSPGVELREGTLTYSLRPSIELFPASSGELFLLRPGEAGDLVVRRPDPTDRALIDALAARAYEVDELSALLDVPREAVRARLRALLDAGAVVAYRRGAAALPAPRAERYDRQLPYFAECCDDPIAAQQRLGAATVVILGCGGLGSWALSALAAAGVGHFHLIDHDAVDLSNLNRQILFRADDLGQPKVDCAARTVADFDPEIEVRTERRRVSGPEDLSSVLAGADALVQAADCPPYGIVRWVDEACRAAGVPYITAGQVPPVLKIGPTYIPGRTACFTCHEISIRRAFPHYDELAQRRDEHPARATTLGPASGVVGTLLAMELLHLLVGMPVATEGRALILDMRTLETRWETVARIETCPACHDVAE